MKKSLIVITASAILASVGLHGGVCSPSLASATLLPAPQLAWFGWFKKDEPKETEAATAEAEVQSAAAEADKTMQKRVEELKKMALSTKALMEEHADELEAVTNALRAIPLNEQLSAKAREYQGQVAELTETINGLRQKLEGYVSQLEAMGVPVDQYLPKI